MNARLESLLARSIELIKLSFFVLRRRGNDVVSLLHCEAKIDCKRSFYWKNAHIDKYEHEAYDCTIIINENIISRKL